MSASSVLGRALPWRRSDVDRADLPLVKSALNLMGSTVLTAGLGLPFWALAAALVDPRELGRDAALIATMMALSAVAQLNAASGLARFLPRLRKRTAPTLTATYATIVAAAVVLGAGFVVVAPLVDGGLAYVRDPWVAALYVVGLASWTIFTVQDIALTAVRRASLVPVANGAYSVAKVIALPLLVLAGVSNAVFVAWVVPALLTLVPVTRTLYTRAIPQHVATQPAGGELSTAGFDRRALVRFLGGNYVGDVLYQAGLLLLPVIVVASLGASDNAYFAVAFTLVATFTTLAHNAVMAFTIEGVIQRGDLALLLRTVVLRILAPLVALSVVLAAAAPLVLLPFGGDYVDNSAGTLRILAAATVFRVVVWLFEARCRLDGQAWPIVAVNALGLAVLLPLALALTAAHGGEGTAVAWLIASAVMAVAVVPGFVIWSGRAPGLSRWADRVSARATEAPPGWAVALRAQPPLALAALTACVVAPLLVSAGAPAALRFPAVLALMALGPGSAFLLWLRARWGGFDSGLVIMLSLGITMVLAQAMVSLGLWHPLVAVWLLALGSGGAIVAHGARR